LETECKKKSFSNNYFGRFIKNSNSDGLTMAESVKTYLVNTFAQMHLELLKRSKKPNIPSEQPGGTQELALLMWRLSRVSIESTLQIY
jgi:hypothetical protein